MQMVALTLLSLVAAAEGKTGPSKSAPQFKTEEEKIMYAVGISLGRHVIPFNPSKAELEWIKRGIADTVSGAKPAVEMEKYGPQITQLQNKRSAAKAEIEKGKAKAFQDKAAAEPGAQKLPSGLIYKEESAGAGASPKPTDTVKVHYRGTLTDGTEFDSSYSRNQPAEFALNGVIPCWTEGLQKMKVGGKSKLICPSGIAYGDQGRPPQIPGGATLVFNVELLEVKPPPTGAPASGQPPRNPPTGH